MSVQSQFMDAPAPAAQRAGGSSFYFAMRILGREQREAMFEIYAFCRAVDDIADSDEPSDRRLQQLAAWRSSVALIYAGHAPPALAGLARAVTRFGLHEEDFLAVIDGMEMDAREDIQAPAFDELDLYCDRVASAVGRLSVRVFGMGEDDGRKLAHHLGRALQLTNILRDLDEDAAVNRLYLPREALQTAGIGVTNPAAAITDARITAACNVVAERARAHFAEAEAIMARTPRRQVRAPKIMGEVYRQMLAEMTARGWSAPRERVHVNKSHLLWIALRHAFI